MALMCEQASFVGGLERQVLEQQTARTCPGFFLLRPHQPSVCGRSVSMEKLDITEAE